MSGQGGDASRRVLRLEGRLEPVQVVRAYREALLVLRSSIDDARFDAISDGLWPSEMVQFVDRALAMSSGETEAAGPRVRKRDLRKDIRVDVRDDVQFEVLLALVPFTIDADGYAGNRLIFSASDTGTGLWIAVTELQESELTSRLQALDIAVDAFGPASSPTGRALP